MKQKLIYLLTISLLVFFAACSESDEDPTEPTDGDTAEQYYPGGVGSTFTYEGESTDSNNVNTPYQREVTYSQTQTENNTEYILQKNAITVGPSTTTGEFLFRTSSTGMFIYIDPAVFTEILDSIDTGGVSIDIEADPELRLIAYPFANTPTWNAFSVSVDVSIISVNIFELTGNYRGKETVTVMDNDLDAEKVEYVATIKIPESVDQFLSGSYDTITLSAFAWFVKDVGLVKIQGSGLILGAFGSGELEFEDEGGNVSEILINYDIQ